MLCARCPGDPGEQASELASVKTGCMLIYSERVSRDSESDSDMWLLFQMSVMAWGDREREIYCSTSISPGESGEHTALIRVEKKWAVDFLQHSKILRQ